MRTNGSITPEPVDCGEICVKIAPLTVPVAPALVRSTTVTPLVPSGLEQFEPSASGAVSATLATSARGMITKNRFDIVCLLLLVRMGRGDAIAGRNLEGGSERMLRVSFDEEASLGHKSTVAVEGFQLVSASAHGNSARPWLSASGGRTGCRRRGHHDLGPPRHAW